MLYNRIPLLGDKIPNHIMIGLGQEGNQSIQSISYRIRGFHPVGNYFRAEIVIEYFPVF